MEPRNPGEAQPNGSQLNPVEPSPNAGNPAPSPINPSQAEALTLDELNRLTGREFKSKDSALKSIKDTFEFATKRNTDIYNQVSAAQTEENRKTAEALAATQKEMFYLQNPQYVPHRKLIDNLGKNPMEVVQSDIFKETYSKLDEHDKTVRLKTVLESNPRLAASRDGMSKASELKKAQNGIVTDEVARLATEAVIDAFELRS